MAVELSIRIQGHSETKLAIFVQENEFDGTLSDIRTTISKQDIEVPKEYKFLSSNGNFIPWAIEGSLSLRQLLFPESSQQESISKESKDTEVKTELSDTNLDRDNGNTVEDNYNKLGAGSSVPELWIASTSTSMDENSFYSNTNDEPLQTNPDKSESEDPIPTCRSRSGQRTDFREEESVSHGQGPSTESDAYPCGTTYNRAPPPPGHTFCPWKGFVNMVHEQNRTISIQSLFKILFFLLVVLFMMLFSLALMTHVVSVTCEKSLIRRGGVDNGMEGKISATGNQEIYILIL